jgi:prephenate dehydrogenase
VRTGVVGLGLIGGSLLRALGAAGADARGYDADAYVRDAAAAEGFAVAGLLAELGDCDVIVVAVPPETTPATVAAALEAAPRSVVADAASVKCPVIEALRGLPQGSLDRFVGAHPLAGAETAGWASSAPEIVGGAVWAVCPSSHDAPLEPLLALGAAVDLIDGRLVACSAREHDEAVARTSHVPHVTAQALARGLGSEEALLRAALSANSYRDMTRVARSDPALWVEILSANRAAVVSALDELLDELRWYRAALEGGDRDGLASTWGDAHDALAGLDRIRWAAATWEERVIGPAAWDPLLALGRAGHAVRRLRMVPGEGEDDEPALVAEVAA